MEDKPWKVKYVKQRREAIELGVVDLKQRFSRLVLKIWTLTDKWTGPTWTKNNHGTTNKYLQK
jgi:hypothetical protein